MWIRKNPPFLVIVVSVGSIVLERSWHCFVKLKLQISYNTGIPLLATFLREISAQDTCTEKVIGEQFLIEENLKQL